MNYATAMAGQCTQAALKLASVKALVIASSLATGIASLRNLKNMETCTGKSAMTLLSSSCFTLAAMSTKATLGNKAFCASLAGIISLICYL